MFICCVYSKCLYVELLICALQIQFELPLNIMQSWKCPDTDVQSCGIFIGKVIFCILCYVHGNKTFKQNQKCSKMKQSQHHWVLIGNPQIPNQNQQNSRILLRLMTIFQYFRIISRFPAIFRISLDSNNPRTSPGSPERLTTCPNSVELPQSFYLTFTFKILLLNASTYPRLSYQQVSKILNHVFRVITPSTLNIVFPRNSLKFSFENEKLNIY